MSEFRAWPKTPRLFRDVTITEKIDGTNAAVIVAEDGRVFAQSRKRLITPDDDNFGFATWVHVNAGALADTLGVGYHFGEWWGSGIQRNYGYRKGERFFSLFNTNRWDEWNTADVDGLGAVPIVEQGSFSDETIDLALTRLREQGSWAAPGFMNPEGIVVYHHAANQVFKVTMENDAEPKSVAA